MDLNSPNREEPRIDLPGWPGPPSEQGTQVATDEKREETYLNSLNREDLRLIFPVDEFLRIRDELADDALEPTPIEKQGGNDPDDEPA